VAASLESVGHVNPVTTQAT